MPTLFTLIQSLKPLTLSQQDREFYKEIKEAILEHDARVTPQSFVREYARRSRKKHFSEETFKSIVQFLTIAEQILIWTHNAMKVKAQFEWSKPDAKTTILNNVTAFDPKNDKVRAALDSICNQLELNSASPADTKKLDEILDKELDPNLDPNMREAISNFKVLAKFNLSSDEKTAITAYNLNHHELESLKSLGSSFFEFMEGPNNTDWLHWMAHSKESDTSKDLTSWLIQIESHAGYIENWESRVKKDPSLSRLPAIEKNLPICEQIFKQDEASAKEKLTEISQLIDSVLNSFNTRLNDLIKHLNEKEVDPQLRKLLLVEGQPLETLANVIEELTKEQVSREQQAGMDLRQTTAALNKYRKASINNDGLLKAIDNLQSLRTYYNQYEDELLAIHNIYKALAAISSEFSKKDANNELLAPTVRLENAEHTFVIVKSHINKSNSDLANKLEHLFHPKKDPVIALANKTLALPELHLSTDQLNVIGEKIETFISSLNVELTPAEKIAKTNDFLRDLKKDDASLSQENLQDLAAYVNYLQDSGNVDQFHAIQKLIGTYWKETTGKPMEQGDLIAIFTALLPADITNLKNVYHRLGYLEMFGGYRNNFIVTLKASCEQKIAQIASPQVKTKVEDLRSEEEVKKEKQKEAELLKHEQQCQQVVSRIHSSNFAKLTSDFLSYNALSKANQSYRDELIGNIYNQIKNDYNDFFLDHFKQVLTSGSKSIVANAVKNVYANVETGKLRADDKLKELLNDFRNIYDENLITLKAEITQHAMNVANDEARKQIKAKEAISPKRLSEEEKGTILKAAINKEMDAIVNKYAAPVMDKIRDFSPTDFNNYFVQPQETGSTQEQFIKTLALTQNNNDETKAQEILAGNTNLRRSLHKFTELKKLDTILEMNERQPEVAVNNYMNAFKNSKKVFTINEDGPTKRFFKAVLTTITGFVFYNKLWKTKGDQFASNVSSLFSMFNHQKKTEDKPAIEQNHKPKINPTH